MSGKYRTIRRRPPVAVQRGVARREYVPELQYEPPVQMHVSDAMDSMDEARKLLANALRTHADV
jgi:hypothetical protein